MKNLFIALLCTTIGFNASAENLKPSSTSSVVVKAEVESSSNNKREIKVTENKAATTAAYRRSLGWKFKDSCGNTMTVWVTGSDINQMYNTAEAYAEDHTSWWSGCFN